MTRHRLLAAAASLALVGAFIPVTVAQAAVTTYQIGVDNTSPSGHNWEFLDYFPRSGVNVHNGDIIHFKLGSAPDGFHTATLGVLGQTPDQIAAASPALAPDTSTGDAAGAQEFAAFFGTNPPPGSGAPGACGDAGTPCTYDGTSLINSGPMPVVGTDFYYKINLKNGSPNAPTAVNYICSVHGPAMSASFVIVPDASTASTQSGLDTAATSQYNADVSSGNAAEAAANTSAVTTNANGTKNVTMQAGTESPDGRVQILEMLPSNVNVTAGDTVTWKAGSRNDPHTVSFPQGVDTHDPFNLMCEGSSGDTPPTSQTPPFGCAGPPGAPNGAHLDYDPSPSGGTTITSATASATTTTSSGVISQGTNFGTVPSSYTFTFANAGTYKYQCLIHDHMLGTITVAAAAAPALPKSGVIPKPAGEGGLPLLPLGAVALALAGVAATAVRIRAARGTRG